MWLAVFGGTGRVGGRLIAAAQRRGHGVRALVRDPARWEAPAGCVVVPGDVLDPAAVAATVAGCDAALVALGGGSIHDPGRVRSAGMSQIAAACAAHGVGRIVGLAGGGVLDADGGGLRQEQPGYPAVFAAVSREHRGAWEALRAGSVPWTLFCPPDIPDRPATGQYRLALDRMPDGPGREIAAGDLADAMLDALTADAWVGRRIGIKH